MARIKISSIPIDIPYPPYPSQIVTMTKIISCLQEGCGGIIESPTGTGKSLSIICSVLAWAEHYKRNEIVKSIKKDQEGNISQESADTLQIIICSRTHKQLDQLVNQLRKTRYRPRMSILASRTQYCISPKLVDVSDKNTACCDLLKNKACIYFNNKDRLSKKMSESIHDIEDLRREGKQSTACPYYASRILADKATLVFAPYNYILDPAIRSTLNISLHNTILLIDEAHNVEDTCRSAGSLDLTSNILDILNNELVSSLRKIGMSSLRNELLGILGIIKKIKDYCDNSLKNKENVSFNGAGFNNKKDIRLSAGNIKENTFFNNLPVNNNESYKNTANNDSKNSFANSFYDKKDNDFIYKIKKGKEIVNEFNEIGLDIENIRKLKGHIYALNSVDEGRDLIGLSSSQIIESLLFVADKIMIEKCEGYALVFQRSINGRSGYSLNLWLLDPSYIFKQVASSCRALVLLSGTLVPFNAVMGELGADFKHVVEAPHVISPSNVFICALDKGYSNNSIIGTYGNMASANYLDQISKAISDIKNAVGSKGGVLVFVPSYVFLEKLGTILEKLKFKNLFLEPKIGKLSAFENILKNYKKCVQNKQNAVLLCVFRGKASEGVDFKDDLARAVIGIGIPFPSFKDVQVELKREYNDKFKKMNGRAWYEMQAYRAVNQAIGRVVRHKEDWGAVFLLDARYKEKRSNEFLSKWIRENIKSYPTYEESIKNFKAFVDSK
ncbi:DNA repair helicase Rad3 [Hamiltosporidium tvaerminnensis]|uniref:DNA 5'-3' helicase n=1 Tax=Hamiltosporidium tvaerminnensis TaxID=1176355 RepID=A0A4Q9LXZ2_9MICR|nr:DNA repair helicase Rad3 [Hamiltosporidium tvaerminnensis]